VRRFIPELPRLSENDHDPTSATPHSGIRDYIGPAPRSRSRHLGPSDREANSRRDCSAEGAQLRAGHRASLQQLRLLPCSRRSWSACRGNRCAPSPKRTSSAHWG
jgi:hypothetical protein